MFIVGSSSTDNALRDAPKDLKSKLCRYTSAVRGFSFNHRNPNRSKLTQLHALLIGKPRQITIWHDCSNNSISDHPIKKVGKLTVAELVDKLIPLKHRIAAILYLQCLRAPYVVYKFQKHDVRNNSSQETSHETLSDPT